MFLLDNQSENTDQDLPIVLFLRGPPISLTRDTFRYLWRVLILRAALQGSPGCRLRVPRASGDRNQMPETRVLVQFRTFRVQN